MITEFLRPKREFGFGEAEELGKVKAPLRAMEQPELSLGPSVSTFAKSTYSSSSDSDANSRKKRKHAWDEHPAAQTSSGRMYYLNRKTLKKSWIRPKEQALNLELNIATLASSDANASSGSVALDEPRKHASSGGNMVAVVCANCHLLVMLCKSSPSCPNCKYVHSLQPPPRHTDAVKPVETLSLLH
uniref:WW domain-containing protein n=1 Tax=Ananas comosus var. bracteatus TaxID=296719 RepID=A0A6V7NNN0_ANACO|nr:unnamed protein product [Ananas comosus var. bracteatus]